MALKRASFRVIMQSYTFMYKHHVIYQPWTKLTVGVKYKHSTLNILRLMLFLLNLILKGDQTSL